MKFYDPFSNPYMAPFIDQLDAPEPVVTRSSSLTDDTLVFTDDFEEPKFITVSDLPGDTDLDFRDTFHYQLPPKAYSKPQRTSNVFSSKKTPSPSPFITSYISPTKSSPVFLALTRHGLTNNTILSDPITNNIIYHFHDTAREFYSLSHDIEITRTIPTPKTIGTIRYGPFESQIKLTTPSQTGKRSWTNIHELPSPCQNPSTARWGKTLIWKITKSRRRRPTPPPSVRKSLKDMEKYMTSLVYRRTDAEMAVLELREPNKDLDNDPLCVVRLYATLPRATFEFRTAALWEDTLGGRAEWAALDELVVSAYANMDLARRRLMRGSGLGASSFAVSASAGWGPHVAGMIK